MRPTIALFALLILAAPSAQAAARKPPPSVASAGLRGSETPGDGVAAAPPAKPAPARLLSPTPRASLAVNGALHDSGECRLACAHSYYRCAPTQAADNCPVLWTLCLAACARVDQRRR
jgi:hypothetical protein